MKGKVYKHKLPGKCFGSNHGSCNECIIHEKDFGKSFDKLPLKLQKLREEKEEAVISPFRVGPHSGTGTA